MIHRIAILGGSSVYTPQFLQSLISHNLNVKEIMLYGREGDKLPTVTAFCQRLVHRSGFPIEIKSSTNLEEAVEGATYVLNHVRVGGLRARLRDEKLPVKQGMVGDESLGAGGFANAMRTLPVVFDFAKRIEAVNPDCTFINLTNPMGVVVEAMIRYSKLNVIGVCDLPGAYVKKVAQLLGCDCKQLIFDYIGLNHMGWIQNVRQNGSSLMGKVIDRIEASGDDAFDHQLIDLFRMVPTRTTSLYFHQDEILKRQKACSRFRAEILYEAEQQILKLYRDEHLCEIPDLTRERNTVWYEDTITPLIEALENDKPKSLILCVQNEGAIRDLPPDCSVEVPVEVSREGLKPRKVGDCPRFLKGLFEAVKQSDRLAVEAAYHKSYEFALQSLTIHPLVPSYEAAERYLEKIVKEENLDLH